MILIDLWRDVIMCKPFVSLFFAFIVVSTSAFSATLSLEPTTQTINFSETTSVDLLISGLGDFTSPSLGAFDVDINFDNTVISFSTATFGTFLGTSIQGVDTSTPGMVKLDEVSLESVPTLDGLQSDSFLLATLTFDGTGAGTSQLGFGAVVLSDAFGNIIADPTLVPSSVTVVPLSAAVWLFGSGMLGLLGMARRKKV